MNTFSDESQFILKNWDRIQELNRSVQACRLEMAAYLASLEAVLRNQSWWQPDLKFVKVTDKQCYVSREDWKDTEYVVWIGVEAFTIEAIFGGAGGATCYLWLSKRAAELADSLQTLVKRDPELSGLISSGSGQKERYLLQRKLARWYPQELDRFVDSGPVNEIAEFFGRVYAVIKDYRLPEADQHSDLSPSQGA